MCYIGSEEGHSAKYHRQHLSNITEESNQSQAQGNSAKAKEARDTEGESSGSDSASSFGVGWGPILVNAGASHHLTSRVKGFKVTDDNVTLGIRGADGRTVITKAKDRLPIKALGQDISGNELEQEFLVKKSTRSTGFLTLCYRYRLCCVTVIQ